MNALIFTTASGFDVAAFGKFCVEGLPDRHLMVTIANAREDNPCHSFRTIGDFDSYARRLKAHQSRRWIDLRSSATPAPKRIRKVRPFFLIFTAADGSAVAVNSPSIVEEGHVVRMNNERGSVAQHPPCQANGGFTCQGHAPCLEILPSSLVIHVPGIASREYPLISGRIRVDHVGFSAFLKRVAKNKGGEAIDLRKIQARNKAKAERRAVPAAAIASPTPAP